MGKLVFDSQALKRVVDHALTAEVHMDRLVGHKGDKPVYEKTGPCVLLVHDQGVYLMSSGFPRDIASEDTSYTVKAKGCDPELDPDWYDTAHALVGGDDFIEHLPWVEEIKKRIDLGEKKIVINFGKRQISLK